MIRANCLVQTWKRGLLSHPAVAQTLSLDVLRGSIERPA